MRVVLCPGRLQGSQRASKLTSSMQVGQAAGCTASHAVHSAVRIFNGVGHPQVQRTSNRLDPRLDSQLD